MRPVRDLYEKGRGSKSGSDHVDDDQMQFMPVPEELTPDRVHDARGLHHAR